MKVFRPCRFSPASPMLSLTLEAVSPSFLDKLLPVQPAKDDSVPQD